MVSASISAKWEINVFAFSRSLAGSHVYSPEKREFAHNLSEISMRAQTGQYISEPNHRDIDMVSVPTTDLICEYLAEHSGKQVHVKEVADRFNLFTHGASLRMSDCGWHPVGNGYWCKSTGNDP
jgi:hypothetical protein